MELIATPDAVALAYGAYLHEGGTRLRCWLLLVQRGNPHEVVTLQCPTTKQEFRVRFPKQAVNAAGNARFSKEELEIL